MGEKNDCVHQRGSRDDTCDHGLSRRSVRVKALLLLLLLVELAKVMGEKTNNNNNNNGTGANISFFSRDSSVQQQ